MKIIVRDVPPRTVWALEQTGIHPLLAQLYAARGVQSSQELDPSLTRLLPPDGLKGCQDAARLLADAMAKNSASLQITIAMEPPRVPFFV